MGAVTTGAPGVPRPDAAGHVRVPLSDAMPWRLPSKGVPGGWDVKTFTGQPDVELVRDEGRVALRLRSEESSFALYRDAVVDLKEFPLLSWWWKGVRLPASGDVRSGATDDEVAQVYVIFPRWPAPLTTSDVVGYVWDTRAPVGTRLTSPKAQNVKIIVVESGTERRGVWQRYERNVAQDYAALFGGSPPLVGKVAVMIDTDDTRGAAEALVGDLAFSRARSGSAEIPTSMLR